METTLPLEYQPSAAWLLKRKRTMIIFLVETFLLGVEYSIFFLTLWVYIETLVPTNVPKLVYSFAASAYLLSAVVMSAVVGKLVDKYRNIRGPFIVCNTLLIIGNVLYTINLSPAYLIMGRLIAGCGAPLKSVVSGEIVRSFPPCETSAQFAKVGLSFGLGFVIGPALNTIFKGVEFTVYTWQVTAANVTGLYMAGLFVILQIIVILFICNLSQEYDMKGMYEKYDLENSSTRENDNTKRDKSAVTISLETYVFTSDKIEDISGLESIKVIDAETKQRVIYNPRSSFENYTLAGGTQLSKKVINETTPIITPIRKHSTTVKNIFLHLDSLLVLVFSFLFMYGLVTFDLWMPMMVIDVLKWNLMQLNLIVFGSAILAIIGFGLIIYKPPSSTALYYLMFLSIICMFLLLILFLLIKLFKMYLSVTILLWCLFAICFTVVCVMVEVYPTTTLAKMVPSSQQTLTESIRLGFARCGSLTALLTSPYLFEWLEIYVIVFCCIWFFGFLLFILRGKHLKDPERII